MNPNNEITRHLSKEKLISALLLLMETYSFPDITVTQICQEAHLSRKTFYRLFQSKEELIIYEIETILDNFAEEYKSCTKKDYWDALPNIFEFLKKQKHFLLLLNQNNLLYLFSMQLDALYERLLLIKDPHHPVIESNPYLPYMSAYSMGGLSRVLMRWISLDMKDDPKDFIAYIQKIYSTG